MVMVNRAANQALGKDFFLSSGFDSVYFLQMRVKFLLKADTFSYKM